MILRNIIDAVCAEARALGESWLDEDYILKTLDVRGASNSELSNPLNGTPEVFHFRPRDVPLDGTEELNGDYLLFDYCGHDESMWLKDFPSIADLEDALLGDAGITNPFTTLAIAIVSGSVTRYRVYYLDNAGRRVAFDKAQQYAPCYAERLHSDRSLEWSPDLEQTISTTPPN